MCITQSPLGLCTMFWALKAKGHAGNASPGCATALKKHWFSFQFLRRETERIKGMIWIICHTVGKCTIKGRQTNLLFKPESVLIVRDFRCCFCRPKKELDKTQMNVIIMRSDVGMFCQKKIHNRQKFKRRAKQLVQRSPELKKHPTILVFATLILIHGNQIPSARHYAAGNLWNLFPRSTNTAKMWPGSWV